MFTLTLLLTISNQIKINSYKTLKLEYHANNQINYHL